MQAEVVGGTETTVPAPINVAGNVGTLQSVTVNEGGKAGNVVGTIRLSLYRPIRRFRRLPLRRFLFQRKHPFPHQLRFHLEMSCENKRL
jgi:hypothetical protein